MTLSVILNHVEKNYLLKTHMSLDHVYSLVPQVVDNTRYIYYKLFRHLLQDNVNCDECTSSANTSTVKQMIVIMMKNNEDFIVQV